MAQGVITCLTAHSSEAATQRRNAVARYRLQLLDRRDAMANASVPVASSRREHNSFPGQNWWPHVRAIRHQP